MNTINTASHAVNHAMRTSRGRPSHSRTGIAALVASLAAVGLGPISIQVAHATSGDVLCSANELINAINTAASGDVLSLREGCVYVLTHTVPSPDPALGYNGLPVIGQKLTIKGNGATITRQKSTSAVPVPKFRIFLVAHAGGDLTISDLTIDNGETSGSETDPRAGRGGGISNLGTLNVTNGTFSHNHGSFGGGGIGNGIPQEPGVSAVRGDLTLSDSVFFDNSGGTGAAIANGATSTMNLTECTISDNTASIEGGGVANQGTAILNKCTISGNTVTGSDPHLLGGGGVDNGGQLFLTDSPISGNSVKFTGSGNQNGFGGGLLNVASAFATLTHSNVIDNSATNFGGGILNGAFQGEFGTVRLISSDVTGNSSAASGGGIGNQGHMTITQSNVTGNNTMGDGGGIVNFTFTNATPVADLTLTHSDVTGNSAAGHGGGIANVRLMGATPVANLTLTHSDVTDNKAGNDGGGIFNQNVNKVTVNQSMAAGNIPDDF